MVRNTYIYPSAAIDCEIIAEYLSSLRASENAKNSIRFPFPAINIARSGANSR